jgi:hypothetical protein
MTRIIYGLFLLLAIDGQSEEPNNPKGYLCIPDYATGFSVEKSGEWRPTQFSVNGKKYMLHTKNGNWYWNKFGEEPDPHIDSCTSPTKLGFQECKNGEEEIVFNNKTLRFQVVHPYGYVVADIKMDKHPITPYYEIGKCSEI